MALDPLATVDDLAARGVDAAEESGLEDRVAALLDSASAIVRDAAGATISLTTSTITLTGSASQWLPLPVVPVREVTEVTLNGTEISDYYLRDGRLWRAQGWGGDYSPPGARWPWYGTAPAPPLITVTVQHGLTEVPADIVDLVCRLVADGLAAAEDGFESRAGLQSVRIDDYSETYETGAGATATAMTLTTVEREALRARFGGGAYVIGSYS